MFFIIECGAGLCTTNPIARICNPCPQRWVANIICTHKANLLKTKKYKLCFCLFCNFYRSLMKRMSTKYKAIYFRLLIHWVGTDCKSARSCGGHIRAIGGSKHLAFLASSSRNPLYLWSRTPASKDAAPSGASRNYFDFLVSRLKAF